MTALQRLLTRVATASRWVSATVFVGCSAPQMQVPSELAAHADLLPVTQRGVWTGVLVNESFKLGPYAVTNVDRKWDVTTGFVAGNLSHSNTEGGYAFSFEGAGMNETGHCAIGKKDTGVKYRSGVNVEFRFSKLACSCEGTPELATVVVESSSNEYTGTLTTSAGTYRVASVHELVGGSRSEDPVGYRIDGARGVGAAEVIHPGRVWLARSLDAKNRGQIACLVAGLMLFVPKDAT